MEIKTFLYMMILVTILGLICIQMFKNVVHIESTNDIELMSLNETESSPNIARRPLALMMFVFNLLTFLYGLGLLNESSVMSMSPYDIMNVFDKGICQVIYFIVYIISNKMLMGIVAQCVFAILAHNVSFPFGNIAPFQIAQNNNETIPLFTPPGSPRP